MSYHARDHRKDQSVISSSVAVAVSSVPNPVVRILRADDSRLRE